MHGTKNLLTYRYAEIIQDLTSQFCAAHVSKYSRTIDQMIQAARSGKQNIIEGVGQSQTSKKGEIKLLGVAKASFEELLADYEDFLRQDNLPVYQKDHPKTAEFRQQAYSLSNISNLSHLGHLIAKPVIPEARGDAANFLLTLCHIETYLLHRQVTVLIQRFEESGGFTENLYKHRAATRAQKFN